MIEEGVRCRPYIRLGEMMHSLALRDLATIRVLQWTNDINSKLRMAAASEKAGIRHRWLAPHDVTAKLFKLALWQIIQWWWRASPCAGR